MEAGGVAMQPDEQAGISEDVIVRLQEKATVLTQERKRRGRSVPEDLLSQDTIKSFQTLASHPVIYLRNFTLISLISASRCTKFRYSMIYLFKGYSFGKYSRYSCIGYSQF